MDVREKMVSEKRLIEANVLVKDIELLAKHEDSFRQSVILGVVHTVEAQSTVDAVEVVRCCECKSWDEETGFCEKNSYFVDADGVCCSPADSPNWTMFDPDDFCSYGERKEGAE